MLGHKYTSIERVIENVIRDTGFTDEVDFVEIIEWAYRAMELIGAPQIYITRVTDGDKAMNHPDPVVIENYKGELPCDMHRIIQIREWCNKGGLSESTTDFIKSANTPEAYVGEVNNYKIDEGWIFTNFQEGLLEIAYEAFPVDANGYPSIPDDERYLKAVESYICERIATRLWIQDKISTEKKNHFEREWLFYVRSAKTRAQMPTIDGMEALKNQVLRLISHPDRHKNQFLQSGDMEQIRTRSNRFNKYL